MSVFKKILSVFNDLTDHTVLADDTVSANIKTKDIFLTKEFEENLLAFYDQMPAQMKNSVYHDNYVFFVFSGNDDSFVVVGSLIAVAFQIVANGRVINC